MDTCRSKYNAFLAENEAANALKQRKLKEKEEREKKGKRKAKDYTKENQRSNTSNKNARAEQRQSSAGTFYIMSKFVFLSSCVIHFCSFFVFIHRR